MFGEREHADELAIYCSYKLPAQTPIAAFSMVRRACSTRLVLPDWPDKPEMVAGDLPHTPTSSCLMTLWLGRPYGESDRLQGTRLQIIVSQSSLLLGTQLPGTQLPAHTYHLSEFCNIDTSTLLTRQTVQMSLSIILQFPGKKHTTDCSRSTEIFEHKLFASGVHSENGNGALELNASI